CGGRCVAECPAGPGFELDALCSCSWLPGTTPCGGGCAANCPSGETLNFSTCRCDVSCPAGMVPCGANCVNANDDPTNCGGCGVECGPNRACNDGVCCVFQDQACQADAGCCGFTAGSTSGARCCDNVCIFVTSD